MRASVIVNIHEVVEAPLLLQEVEGGGRGGFGLECQVHALMASVLLRLAGADPLEADAEPQPTDGELREVVEAGGGGKGQAVVAADCLR